MTALPGGSDGKKSACDAGGQDSTPGPRRSPGAGDGSTSRIPSWEILGQRSLAGCSPRGRKEQDITEQLTLSLFHFTYLTALILTILTKAEMSKRVYKD